jgi:glycosyltransferase involved in cell wall biosynthesis
MKNGKVVVARLWSRYEGGVPSRAPIVLGINPQKYQTICVYLMKNSEKPNFFEEKGLKVFYITKRKDFHHFNFWIIWKLSRILRRENVDILHCHRHKATFYGTIAATLAGTPVIVSHVHGICRTRNLKRKLINFFVLKKVNKIITVSKAVKEDVLGTNTFVQPDKVVSIGNSINYERYANVPLTKTQAKERLNLPPNAFVFGTVGRLAPTKGQTYLIRVFEKVEEALPLAQLILVGDGRLRNELEQQVAETPYGDSIHFLGHRDNIPELLRAMDTFVFPSIAEGLPRALLEAMAAGVPCIGAAAGGIPEIITNNETGFLVPPKDENALAEAMIKSAELSEAERTNLTEKAKQYVRNLYAHKIVIEKLQGLYEDVYA